MKFKMLTRELLLIPESKEDYFKLGQISKLNITTFKEDVYINSDDPIQDFKIDAESLIKFLISTKMTRGKVK